MIFPIFRKRPGTIEALYGSIVAQARLPVFYREYGVPDTPDGRFDLLVLHLGIVLRRMGQGGGAETGQELFDRFCLDMDQNLREMGVSDLKVPKQMRAVGEAFYGRMQAYEKAFAAQDDALLTEGIARNVYGGGNANAAERLASYIRKAMSDLEKADRAALLRGEPGFPDPRSMAATTA